MKDIRAILALWKDADPDIPILKEVKAEYGKLHSRAAVAVLRTRSLRLVRRLLSSRITR